MPIYRGNKLIQGSGGGEAPVLTGDAIPAHVLEGDLFYSDDAMTQEEGTMANNADNDVEVNDLDGETIPEGYYDGTGLAKLSATEAAKVIAENIKKDTVILGVTGSLEAGESEPSQVAVEHTPSSPNINPSIFDFVSVAHEGIFFDTTDRTTSGTAISSGEYSTYYDDQAFDDNDGTEWRVYKSPNITGEWIGIDLGSAYAIVKITIKADTQSLGDFNIEASDNGFDWVLITTGTKTATAEETFVFVNDAEYRYWRIKATNYGVYANRYYLYITEIQMFTAA